MSRRFGLLRCLFGFLAGAGLAVAQSDPPNNYYDAAIGKTGLPLKAALHDIIKGHTQIPYTSSSTDVWDALKVLDEDPTNSARVVLIYSGYTDLKSAQSTGSTGTWNREHLWPQSYGLDDISGSSVSQSDLFNLRPADVNVNSSRNNLYFDVSTSPFSSHAEAPQCSYDGNSWEPRTVEKGDIARSLFYMAVRYDGTVAAEDTPDLELSDTPNEALFRFGKLSTLITWHRATAVSPAERVRNHRIYTTYQHNRNPFVDHPEFADMVFNNATSAQAWKNLRFTTAELANTNISGDLADADGDGLRNLVEYVFLRNPRQPDSSPLFAISKNADGSLQLAFARNRFASDVTVSYEVSTDGLTWSAATTQVLSTSVTNFEKEQVTVKILGASPERLVRLKLLRP